MTADLIFHQEHKANNSIKFHNQKSARLEWSPFVGCFSQAQWQSILAVWGPNGVLASWGWVYVVVQFHGADLRPVL